MQLRLPAYGLAPLEGRCGSKTSSPVALETTPAGVETHVSVRANVLASAGGFTAWAAAINAQIRPGVGDLPNP